MSFDRAYSKHEASYIFRIKDLDLVGVAKSFGLLRLPRMPELKDVDRRDWQDAEVDWDAYAYTDAAKEASRLAELEKQKLVDKEKEAEKQCGRRRRPGDYLHGVREQISGVREQSYSGQRIPALPPHRCPLTARIWARRHEYRNGLR